MHERSDPSLHPHRSVLHAETRKTYSYKTMPRILLISSAYPPPPCAGAARITRMMRWLPKRGFDCTLLTVARERMMPGAERMPNDPPNVYRVSVPSRSGPAGTKASLRDVARKSLAKLRVLAPVLPKVRRLRHSINVFAFPDAVHSWIRKGVRQGLAVAAAAPVDLIYSSVPSISGHFIAAQLAVQLRVPWAHEYRDIWAGNPWRSTRPYWWRDQLERYWERRFLRQADAAVVMTPSSAKILASRSRGLASVRIHVVPNGFDAREFKDESPVTEGLPLRLVYTGTLYGGQRDVSGLFASLGALIEYCGVRPDELEFHYAGADGASLHAAALQAGISCIVRDHGVVESSEALRLQQSAHVLVLVEKANDDPWILGNMPSKAYEYLGARRPVLVLAHPKGAIAELYSMTRAGTTVHPNDSNRMREYLQQAVASLRARRRLEYDPHVRVVASFEWQAISELLAKVLSDVRHRKQ